MTNFSFGTSGADSLVTATGDDYIIGLGSNDTIEGGQGIDILSGGDGNDIIEGNQDNDHIYGGPGADSLYGGTGNDVIWMSDGDLVYSGSGNDTIAVNVDWSTSITVDIQGFNTNSDHLVFYYEKIQFKDTEIAETVNVTWNATTNGFDISHYIDSVEMETQQVLLAPNGAITTTNQPENETTTHDIGSLAATILVDNSQPISVINQIIENAPDGTTIIFEEGEYDLTETGNPNESIIVDRSNVTLKGSETGNGVSILIDGSTSPNGGSTDKKGAIQIGSLAQPTALELIVADKEDGSGDGILIAKNSNTFTVTQSVADQLDIGDLVLFNIPDTNEYFTSINYNPAEESVREFQSQIIQKSQDGSNYLITLEDDSPYDFDAIHRDASGSIVNTAPGQTTSANNDNSGFLKLNYIKNVHIENFKVKNTQAYLDENLEYDPNDSVAGSKNGSSEKNEDLEGVDNNWIGQAAIELNGVKSSSLSNIDVLHAPSHAFKIENAHKIEGEDLVAIGADARIPSFGYHYYFERAFHSNFESIESQDARHALLFSSYSAEHDNIIHFKSVNRDINFHGSPDSGNEIYIDEFHYEALDNTEEVGGNDDAYQVAWLPFHQSSSAEHPHYLGPSNSGTTKQDRITADVNVNNDLQVNVFEGDDELAIGDVVYGMSSNNANGRIENFSGSSLSGNGGDDLLWGNDSNDTIYGGSGDDTLIGEGANDSLIGGGGDDHLEGGAGEDKLWGSSGSDVIIGNASADEMYGGAGDDIMRGGSGSDTLEGGSGDDNLEGYSGDDTIFGGTGEDQIFGGAGKDLLYAVSDDQGTDSANDTLYGGSAKDSLYGSIGVDHLYGDSGDDKLYALAGNDSLDGGLGADSLKGFSGDDTIFGGTGDDTIFGGAGGDLLYAVSDDQGTDSANDKVYGGSGNDSVYGSAGDNFLYGETGNDSLYALAGNDGLYGGSGDDSLKGFSGDDTISGGDGNDSIFGYSHQDSLTGYSGNDILDGGGDNDSLNGSGGSDTLKGGAGNDEIKGGAGNDSIEGNSGNDTINGNSGNDVLTGNHGSDEFVFTDNWGNDTITDFSSGDTEIIIFDGIATIYDWDSLVNNKSFDAVSDFLVIDVGSDTILVEGVTSTNFGVGKLYSENDFSFI
jgi:Ca2+-binding RTX toxin-like protein